MGEHVQPVRRVYRRFIVVTLDVMRRVDVFSEVEKVHAVESHEGRIVPPERRALIQINNRGFFDSENRGPVRAISTKVAGCDPYQREWR